MKKNRLKCDMDKIRAQYTEHSRDKKESSTINFSGKYDDLK